MRHVGTQLRETGLTDPKLEEFRRDAGDRIQFVCIQAIHYEGLWSVVHLILSWERFDRPNKLFRETNASTPFFLASLYDLECTAHHSASQSNKLCSCFVVAALHSCLLCDSGVYNLVQELIYREPRFGGPLPVPHRVERTLRLSKHYLGIFAGDFH